MPPSTPATSPWMCSPRCSNSSVRRGAELPLTFKISPIYLQFSLQKPPKRLQLRVKYWLISALGGTERRYAGVFSRLDSHFDCVSEPLGGWREDRHAPGHRRIGGYANRICHR